MTTREDDYFTFSLDLHDVCYSKESALGERRRRRRGLPVAL